LVSGQKLAYSANRHTTHFDVKTSNMKIQNAVSAITDETKRFQHWWDKPVNDEQVAEMFKKTIVKGTITDAQANSGFSDINKKQLYILMGLYDQEVKQIHGMGDYGRKSAKGSLWCAYQSATAWSTHLGDVTSKTVDKKHIVQQKRQSKIRDMINSKSWKQLEEV
jgi:L-ascorbate metabolism protein UlaG (beta-lactamase superfamily)